MKNDDIKLASQYYVTSNKKEEMPMAMEVISSLKRKVKKLYIVWIITVFALVSTNIAWIIRILL